MKQILLECPPGSPITSSPFFFSLSFLSFFFFFFFFNDTATTEIYTLSLHDALPISGAIDLLRRVGRRGLGRGGPAQAPARLIAAHVVDHAGTAGARAARRR